ETCLWEPAPGCWTVRPGQDGVWRPDWADTEPDPAPPLSIGWLTWHLIWWWSGLLAAVRNQPPPGPHDVPWPGSARAVIDRLDSLASTWSGLLDAFQEGDLERPLAHPWPEPRPLRIALAWANSELMKNVAEIGNARLTYEAINR